MHPRRAFHLTVLAALAAALALGVSSIPAWLTHDRVLLGEGARRVHTLIGAWEGQGLPFLAAALVLVACAAAVALARAGGVAGLRPAWPMLVAAAGLGLLLAGLGPVSQQGHASGVTITPAWALLMGIGLAAVSVAALAVVALPSRRVVTLAGGLVLLLAVGGWGGRQVELNLSEGTGQNYSEGSYTRQAGDGAPTETLTLRGGRITVGDRWSGAYEASGRVVAITADPACPGVRASYHVDAVEGGGITWEKIIDTCAGGERAVDLSTGVWMPDR